MTDWQPIETAPTAQQIIAWEPMYGWLLVSRSPYTKKWMLKSSGNFWHELPDTVELTRWMPLPKPPALPPSRKPRGLPRT